MFVYLCNRLFLFIRSQQGIQYEYEYWNLEKQEQAFHRTEVIDKSDIQENRQIGKNYLALWILYKNVYILQRKYLTQKM